MAFRNPAILVGTTNTPLYTCPAGYEAVVHSLFISNTSATADIEVDVIVNHSILGAPISLITGARVLRGTTLVFDKSINLREDDTLQIKSDTASSCTAYASVLLEDEDTLAP